MTYLGDYAPGDTIDFNFTTRRFSTGAPYTLAGTPAVRCYKGSSTTEDDSGITLTVDYDSRTGLNHVTIDTSADGTFYAEGAQIEVVITAGTVDSVSVVGEVVGRFTLRGQACLYPTIDGRTLNVDASGNVDALLADGAHGGSSASFAFGAGGDIGSLSGQGLNIYSNGDAALYLYGAGVPALYAYGSSASAVKAERAGTGTTAVEIVGTETVSGAVTITGALSAGTNNLPWNAAYDAEVQSECDDALAARGVTTTRTGYLDNLSAGAVATAAKLLSYFQSALRSDVTVDADIGGTYDDATDSQQAIRDRGDAAWTTATGFSTHSAADVWAAGTRTLTAIDEDSTTLDLDATVRAAVGMASADLDTQIATLPTASETATAVLTTQMTEAYASDGTAPTLAQMQFMLWSLIAERSISSVTMTCKKLDGSTTSMTFTLNDATTPTSITRAT